MKKNGYTLVELIITMALLALASTVIIVNMQGVESKQNKSLKERRIAEIEKAACSAIDSLQAEIITGQNRDNCLADGCKIKLSKLVSEGIIDEDLEFDSDGTKIVDIKDLYLVSIKWDTTSDGYKEKKCEFELRDFGTEPIDPGPTPDPNPDPGPTPDPNPDPDPDPTPEPDPTSSSFDYTGSVQEYIIPKSGKYKLEVWGAQGATDTTDKMGGLGGYSRGTISLQKNQKIYIFVGGKGQNINSSSQTGTIRSYPNGGAITVKSKDNYNITYSSGGSSTHIASENKLISDLSSNLQALYIASGGGGGACNWWNYGDNGGNGGGYIGGTTKVNFPNNGVANNNPSGGTQSSGGTGGGNLDGGNPTSYLNGIFGAGGGTNVNSNANISGSGGGGYYGGGASWGGSAGGGSGYIGNSLLTNKVMYCYNCLESSLENTKTISTTCKSSSPQENCAKEGNGYAIISYVE